MPRPSGELFYIVVRGCVHISVDGRRVAQKGVGSGFGELALVGPSTPPSVKSSLAHFFSVSSS